MEDLILCFPKLNQLIFLRINRLGGVLIIKNVAEETIAVGGHKCTLCIFEPNSFGFYSYLKCGVPFSLARSCTKMSAQLPSLHQGCNRTCNCTCNRKFRCLLSVPSKDVRNVKEEPIHGQN